MMDFGFYNMDCLEGMKEFPDKYFDLAIVDPPYGDAGQQFLREDGSRFGGRFDKYSNSEIGCHFHGRGRSARYFPDGIQKVEKYNSDGKLVERTDGTWAAKYEHKIIEWDKAPTDEYFQELFRVSKNQIIWGGNYFVLPPTRCFVVWRKLTISESFTMAMAEYAWTSFNDNAKVFECAPQGKKDDVRFHPTQKPIALYEWLLNKYAKPNDTILDTHVGSASSLIACHKTGHNYVGFEIDKGYYEKAKARLETETAQMNIFDFM